jgi:hypothetical protein
VSRVKFPFEGNTRVALVPAINNIAVPSLAEISAGVDITCDLTADGLRLTRSTATIDVTPWAGDLVIEEPTRRAFSGASLTGFRFLDPDDEILYPRCVFKTSSFLVVRRGVPFEDVWGSGDVVEALGFIFGDRTTADTAQDALATFTVPIFVNVQNDAAVVS